MGKLVLFMDDGTTKAINLVKERVVIGRRPDNDLCLPHPAVSGEHAAVVTILDDSFLEDLNSTNGTLVNGAAVQKHFLRDRDQIDIGRQKLVYLSDETSDVEPDNVRAVRNELKLFGERVEPVPLPPVREYVPDDIEIELHQDAIARAKPRKKAEAARKGEPKVAPAAGSGAKNDAIANAKTDPVHVSGADVDDFARSEANVAGTSPSRNANEAPAAPQSSPFDERAEPSMEADPDPLGERASTNRGLEHMARIRSGDATNGEGANGKAAGTHAESTVERIVERRAPQSLETRPQPARVTVLSGASAGRCLIIERDEVVIGRVGVQVAAIGRGEGGYRLHSREGEHAPLLNGSALPADGAALKSGDIFEVAGARLEFIAAK